MWRVFDNGGAVDDKTVKSSEYNKLLPSLLSDNDKIQRCFCINIDDWVFMCDDTSGRESYDNIRLIPFDLQDYMRLDMINTEALNNITSEYDIIKYFKKAMPKLCSGNQKLFICESILNNYKDVLI